MASEIEIFMIAEISIKIIINIAFLILFFVRIHKLDRMGTNNLSNTNKIIKIKIFLLLFLVIIQFFTIILAYVDIKFWMHEYANYVLVDVSGILILILQIYIIKK